MQPGQSMRGSDASQGQCMAAGVLTVPVDRAAAILPRQCGHSGGGRTVGHKAEAGLARKTGFPEQAAGASHKDKKTCCYNAKC